MKPVDFDLRRPTTLDEALADLAEQPDESKVLAGGQSLLPLLNFRLARPEVVVDLGRIDGLDGIHSTDAELVVGAMVRQARAEHDPRVADLCPLLAAAIPNIAHPPVRSRGTVGGSIAHADPAAELPCVALALDAVLVAVSPRGTREIPASAFFTMFLSTELADDEILTQIRFPRAPARTGAAFVEVGRRKGDFALVGVGISLTLTDDDVVADARIGVSGVSDTPVRAVDAERVLVGGEVSGAALAEAADALRAAIDPDGDLHASGAYRKDVAGVLLERAAADATRTATEGRHDLRTA